MFFRRIGWIVLVAALLAVSGGVTVAGQPDEVACGGSGWWGGGYAYPPSHYSRERVPYFALHPPVYYSTPVPRAYGYSPFAYPGYVRTPEPVRQAPLIIENHFVPQESDQIRQLPKENLVTRAAPMIFNPYVDLPDSVSPVPEVASK